MPYNPEKACKKHGAQYLLLGKDNPKESGLCCYPSCFKAAMTHAAKRFKSTNTMVRMVREYGYLDECVSFLICRLIEEYNARQAPPVLNGQWLFYNLNKFIQQDLVKGVIPQTKVPPVWKKTVDIIEMTDDIVKDLEEANNLTNRYSRGPELSYYDAELLRILENVVGPVWVSFIMRDIGTAEAQKILKLSPARFKKQWAEHKKELQILFKDWRSTKGLNFEEETNEQ